MGTYPSHVEHAHIAVWYPAASADMLISKERILHRMLFYTKIIILSFNFCMFQFDFSRLTNDAFVFEREAIESSNTD